MLHGGQLEWSKAQSFYTGSIHSWAFDRTIGILTGGGERKSHYNSQQALGHPSLGARQVTPRALMGNVVHFPEANRRGKAAPRPKGVVVLRRGVVRP